MMLMCGIKHYIYINFEKLESYNIFYYILERIIEKDTPLSQLIIIISCSIHIKSLYLHRSQFHKELLSRQGLYLWILTMMQPIYVN